YVDGLVGAAVRQAPDVREQVAAGHHPPGPQRQGVEQVEFAAAQGQRRVVPRGLVPPQVKPEAADRAQGGAGRGILGRPPKHRANPGLDLSRAERLDHVVVRPASSTRMMSVSSSRAVTTTTGTELTARIIRSALNPLMSGNPRSSRIRSGGEASRCCSAVMPVGVLVTTCPRSVRVRIRAPRMAASSSTRSSCATLVKVA